MRSNVLRRNASVPSPAPASPAGAVSDFQIAPIAKRPARALPAGLVWDGKALAAPDEKGRAADDGEPCDDVRHGCLPPMWVGRACVGAVSCGIIASKGGDCLEI